MKLPHYINKKNKLSNYYYDSKNDKWIHKTNLGVYLAGLDIELKIYRDKEIRKSRYDLNY